MKFNFDFRRFVEEDNASNVDDTLTRKLGISHTPSNLGPLQISPIDLGTGDLMIRAERLPEFDPDKEDAGDIRRIRVMSHLNNLVILKDVTGRCNKEGTNEDLPGSPCSPKDGKEYRISAKDFDQLRVPEKPSQPPGGGI